MLEVEVEVLILVLEFLLDPEDPELAGLVIIALGQGHLVLLIPVQVVVVHLLEQHMEEALEDPV
jgi:hypothetical protein